MDIQVYADEANIEAEPNAMNVFLKGVDLSLLIGQIKTSDVLDEIDLNEIEEYLNDHKESE